MQADIVLGIDHNPSSQWDTHASLKAELERSREELELIAYAISHDLRAPLRAMDMASEEIQKRLGPDADPKAKLALERLAQSSQRMRTRMQGVLDYLNLQTYAASRSMQQGDEILSSALSLLQGQIKERGARVTADTLPEIYGHSGRLTRLFASLIDNAIKFNTKSPVIHISSRHAENGCNEFGIQDNGIGIEEEFRDIIFQLFHRLHPQGEYAGEGIGLALARKIVETHGGKIRVESNPKEGSCFRFTLPAAKNQ